LADRDLVAPRPRYRVEERGGKLVVIDGGRPVEAQARPGQSGKWFERTSFDGRGVLTTKTFYDLKGPRRVTVGPGSARMMGYAPLLAIVVLAALIGVAVVFPWALVAIPALIQPKMWQRQRARITAWLDSLPPAE
jgi:hypothetical protein